MKFLLRCATWLYPGAWRKRYGAELDALIEDANSGWPDFFDILTGAIQMQIRSMGAWRFAGACGVVGLIVAGVYQWRLPSEYVSRATVQMHGIWEEREDSVERAATDIVSRKTLAVIIRNYNLYPEDTKRKPMDEVARNMSRDIRIVLGTPLQGKDPSVAFQVQFAYSDPGKAQAVTGELSRRFAEAMKESAPTEVLDPATLPWRAENRSRPLLPVAGLLLGIAIGTVLVGIRRWPLVPLTGAAVAILVLPATYLIPDQYRSYATLRGNDGDEGRSVLSLLGDRAFLKSLIVSENLYPKQRRSIPIDGAVDLMLRNLKVIHGSRPEILSLTFEYPDRFQARSVLQKIVVRIAEKGNIRVLDRPSLPETAFTPKRGPIGLAALVAGLLAGAMILLTRRHRTPALAG